jgi:DNA polymerase-3 subunit alpha
LRGFISTRLDQLTPQPHPVLLAGIIHSQRIQMTRRGRMAVLLLDDGNARVEVTVFNELFEQHRHWLKDDQLLIVEGKVAHDDFSGGLRISAEKLFDLQAARSRYARAMRLICNGASSGGKLRELLSPYRSGSCPVSIVYSNRGATCEIDLGDAWRVNLQDGLIESLAAWLSADNVKIVYGERRAGQ